MSFVLDASVAATWCFPDEDALLSDLALSKLGTQEALVPSLFWLEIHNILLVNERRGRIDEADSDAFLETLRQLPIRTRTDVTGSGIMDLGRRHNISSYDARYLDLAVTSRIPLASLDQRLAAAALAEGLPSFPDTKESEE